MIGRAVEVAGHDPAQGIGFEQPALETALGPIVEAEVFGSRTAYDGLNRPVQLIPPRSRLPGARRNVVQPEYNEANLLERVNVWLPAASVVVSCTDQLAMVAVEPAVFATTMRR